MAVEFTEDGPGCWTQSSPGRPAESRCRGKLLHASRLNAGIRWGSLDRSQNRRQAVEGQCDDLTVYALGRSADLGSANGHTARLITDVTRIQITVKEHSSEKTKHVPRQNTLIRCADYYLVSSPFEPFPPNLKAVRLFVSRLRGRAVRRASHDSMSLGRFRFGRQQITWGQPPSAVRPERSSAIY